LAGRLVRLEPLAVAHADGLAAAAAENRDTYSFTTVPHGPEAVADYVESALLSADRGEAVPFAQVRATDAVVVGATRFLSLRFRPMHDVPYAVEIGATWLAASAQRTGLNVEAKLLLMDFAFDYWQVGRVDFKTDARNERSRAAIAGLGATCEGVLRNWQPSHAIGEENLLRDSALYAVVADDWPSVRAGLVARLAAHAP
jgi:RimJ/RimL family protein N-acetyltransferase